MFYLVLEHVLKSSEDCNDCGGKTMNKLSKIISYCIFGICATVCSSNCYATNFSDFVRAVEPLDKSNQSNEKAEYKLTPERQKFIKNFSHALLNEDFENFNEGGGSAFGDILQEKYGYKPVTAEQMFSTYDKNQIKGDKEYINQKLIVTGEIEQIKSSVGNKPVIFMKAGKKTVLSTVNAAFKNPDEDIDKIVNLEKGQKLVLLCIGEGVVLSSPVVGNCEFPDKYQEEYKQRLDESINAFINGKPTGNSITIYSVVTVGYLLSLEDPTYVDKCNKNGCKIDKKVNGKTEKIFSSLKIKKEEYSKLKPKDKALTDKYKKEAWDLLAELKIIDPNNGALLIDDFELTSW